MSGASLDICGSKTLARSALSLSPFRFRFFLFFAAREASDSCLTCSVRGEMAPGGGADPASSSSDCGPSSGG